MLRFWSLPSYPHELILHWFWYSWFDCDLYFSFVPVLAFFPHLTNLSNSQVDPLTWSHSGFGLTYRNCTILEGNQNCVLQANSEPSAPKLHRASWQPTFSWEIPQSLRGSPKSLIQEIVQKLLAQKLHSAWASEFPSLSQNYAISLANAWQLFPKKKKVKNHP